jgi:hypothetical protein
LPPEERKKEEISDEDIVELTLAHINIHGPTEGAHELGRYRGADLLICKDIDVTALGVDGPGTALRLPVPASEPGSGATQRIFAEVSNARGR